VKARLDAGETMESIFPVKVYRQRLHALGMQARLVGGTGRGSVLEVGCGGSLVLHEAAKLGLRCHGVDMNPEMLEYGRTLKAAYGSDVEFSQDDAFALPFADRSFDIVFSVGMLEQYSPEDQLRLVRECKRVANRFVYIEVPNEDEDAGIHHLIKDHEDSHLPTDLRALAIEAGLTDLELDGRAVFCSRAGTEKNSESYQQFVRAGYPHLMKDMTAADIDTFLAAERTTTQAQRLKYGCIHYVVGRSR